MNTVDVIVIGVIGFSTLIAFLRGFVREVLTVGSWIGAAIVTIYGFPLLRGRFESWISSKLAADIAGGIGLFLVTLVVLSVLSHMIARIVRGSALTAVDRSLGLLFGLVRGADSAQLGAPAAGGRIAVGPAAAGCARGWRGKDRAGPNL